jgi:glycosyltransferase involved in cell wall biosynthesis
MAAWKTARLIAPFDAAKIGLRGAYGLDSTLLQVPVDLERIPYRHRSRAERFVTVYGHGGPFDRRAIREIVQAWASLGIEAPPLEVLAQKPIKELEGLELPPSVKIRVGNLPKPSELYQNADVAVLTSKYEGVGLSLIEAQAAGLPVIATDMDPMCRIAPSHLVLGQISEIEIMEGHKIAACTPDSTAIAGRVKELLHMDISEASRLARQRAQDRFSWSSLRNEWLNLLERA